MKIGGCHAGVHAGRYVCSRANGERCCSTIHQRKQDCLELIFGAQKILLEEIVFVSNEIFERARTETNLLSEFISKMAGSHSVRDWRMMLQECSQHQIEFLRRDNERVFRQGQRFHEMAANLLAKRPRP
jgi:hypothetical protein